MPKDPNHNKHGIRRYPISDATFFHPRNGLMYLDIDTSKLLEKYVNGKGQNIIGIILKEEITESEMLDKYHIGDDDTIKGEFSVKIIGITQREKEKVILKYFKTWPLNKYNSQGIKLFNPELQFKVN